MKIDPHSKHYPTHVINGHTRGIICAGEVWIQFCDFATPATVPDWLEPLTPELERYFRSKAADADFANCRDEDDRLLLKAFMDWYANKVT